MHCCEGCTCTCLSSCVHGAGSGGGGGGGRREELQAPHPALRAAAASPPGSCSVPGHMHVLCGVEGRGPYPCSHGRLGAGQLGAIDWWAFAGREEHSSHKSHYSTAARPDWFMGALRRKPKLGRDTLHVLLMSGYGGDCQISVHLYDGLPHPHWKWTSGKITAQSTGRHASMGSG